MATTLSESVAATVRAEMGRLNISEKGLADATGIARVTLRRRLAGSGFTTDELPRIAHALGTTASAILREAETSAAA